MDACETKNMDLFNKVHVFGPMKGHTFGPNINLIRLFSLMFNYAKPRIKGHIHLTPIFFFFGNFAINCNIWHISLQISLHRNLCSKSIKIIDM